MRLLADTHVAIWAVTDDPRLSNHARIAMTKASRVYTSVVSILEIAIKRSMRRQRGDAMPFSSLEAIAEFELAGFRMLDLDARHAATVEHLAPVHADPFDRLLVAQATVEGFSLLTQDAALVGYGDVVIVV